MPRTPQNPQIEPYKKDEFEAFLKILDDGATGHWVEIARSLGVSRDTITAWKTHPRAIEVRQRAITRTLEKMEEAGRRDWRMWEAKLKLLQMSPVDHVDVTSDGEPVTIVFDSSLKRGDA